MFENMLGHLDTILGEIKRLSDEFYDLVRQCNTPTPSINQLAEYTYGIKEPMAFGQKNIPLRWNAIYGIAIIGPPCKKTS
ncbi:hypothetical protein ACSFXN_15780 [Planococcus sp. 1R117A]|uniref:hypothetical protein n=1 Tax=Planococcus sp. 1R117A TaxID=3447020 RepID=UPI003EDB72BE